MSRQQLGEIGVTRHHVRRQVEAQRWRPIGSRVVCVHTGGLARIGQSWAAVLHSGRHAHLGGLTALELMGLRGWYRDDVHVVVPMGVNVPPLPGLVVHRTRVLHAVDLRSADHLPQATTASRSTIDAARWGLRPRAASGLVMAVVQQRLASAEQLARCASAFEWLRNASPILDAIVEASGGADSWAEVEVARLVRQAGLPRPRHQHVIDTEEGPRRLDLAVDLPDGSLLVVEVDGPHHLEPQVRERDAGKDAAVIAAGHAVLRLPLALVRTDPQRVRAQLTAIRHAAAGRDSRNAS